MDKVAKKKNFGQDPGVPRRSSDGGLRGKRPQRANICVSCLYSATTCSKFDDINPADEETKTKKTASHRQQKKQQTKGGPLGTPKHCGALAEHAN